MKILDVLHTDAVIPELKARDKKGVLVELAEPVAEIVGANHDELVRVLMERERLGSTGIGDGIGIPHGKMADIDSMIIAFGLSKKGIEFDSLDGRPANIFFLLLTPEQSTGIHLKLLSQISRILKNDDFKRDLLRAADAKEIINLIDNVDEDF